MFWKRKRIGLALGGGGARGLAHIGVLRVLEREAIPIDLIVGTSVGALVGGAYACGFSPDEVEKKAHEYLNSSEFQSSAMKGLEEAYDRGEAGLGQKIKSYLKNRFLVVQAMFKPGILSNEEFQKTIDYFLPDIEIEETQIPFRAVATDLVSGEQIVFFRGSLRQAVMASCSVPGAIEPLKEGEKLLSDGGITCLIPCSVARNEGAEIVIAVAVDRGISHGTKLRTIVDIYHRVSEIMGQKLKDLELSSADVVIIPEIGDLHWTDFSQAMNLVEVGERAATEKLTDIRRAISPLRKLLGFSRKY
ncbi:MAG: patatin-like phospholipase family protein [Deltaproteobacteria bacterium]|nr:patatin-like phospholipase family protein [Deltaproteobacteria bacterium]